MQDPSLQDQSGQPSPAGIAFTWVGRILAIVVEMVVPGVFGKYLDDWLGTRFLVLAGFALGLTLALWHLIVMTRPRPRENGSVEKPPGAIRKK